MQRYIQRSESSSRFHSPSMVSCCKGTSCADTHTEERVTIFAQSSSMSRRQLRRPGNKVGQGRARGEGRIALRTRRSKHYFDTATHSQAIIYVLTRTRCLSSLYRKWDHCLVSVYLVWQAPQMHVLCRGTCRGASHPHVSIHLAMVRCSRR